MSIQIDRLFYYPVKSFAAVQCQQLIVDTWGPKNDRRLMLVDEHNNFFSQRQCPEMSQMHVVDNSDQLTLSFKGHKASFSWPSLNESLNTMTVNIWQDTCEAQIIDDPIVNWINDRLKRSLNSRLKLVYMANHTHRQVDLEFSEEGVRTGFSDGFPFLLINQASVEFLRNKLNKKAESPPQVSPQEISVKSNSIDLNVKRFRPNIVITGCEPFAEKNWKKIRINGIEFDLVKPCSRCVIPTIDLKTGLKQKEVMQVLLEYCWEGQEVVMGENMLHYGAGILQVGQQVEIVE